MPLYYFVCVVPAAIFCAAWAGLSLHRTLWGIWDT